MAMDHYQTTADQVERVSKETGVGKSVVHAMLESGYSAERIQLSHPDSRFGVWCTWNGLIGWGSSIVRALEQSGYAVTQRAPEPAK